MSNPRFIKKRVKSIKNINKITKALEMVAASKVQRAQDKAMLGKPYSQKVLELVQSLAGEKDVDMNQVPLMRVSVSPQKRLFVLISTNRGLAGSLNTNLFREVIRTVKETPRTNLFITVGKKGRSLALTHGELIGDFSDYNPREAASAAIASEIIDTFTREVVDEVYLVYSDFVSALNQKPTIKKILPLIIEQSESIERPLYSFEPSPTEVLSQLLPFYIEVILAEAIFEAEASEHSARMIAMKNASDNAKSLGESLSLEYNNARQQAITTEINDIVTAGLSLDS